MGGSWGSQFVGRAVDRPEAIGEEIRSVPAVSDELVEATLTLVDRVVAQVAGSFPQHVDRAELRRAGALGLVEAAHRWDAERGVPFEGYAAWRIRGAVLDAARAADWAPRSVRSLSRRIDAAEQALFTELGRRPTDAEVASAIGLDPSVLTRTRAAVVRSAPVALDRSVRAGDDGADLTVADLLVDLRQGEPVELLERRELVGYLHDAVELLDERHRHVIVGTFFEGRSSVELARELGVTESRVSQIRAEAIAQLRWGIGSQYGDPLDPSARRSSVRREEYAEAIAHARRWDQRFDEERVVGVVGEPDHAPDLGPVRRRSPSAIDES